MGSDWCPLWAMIVRSETSAIASAVASPDRNECPAYFSEFSPAAFAQRFTIKATDWSVTGVRDVAVAIDGADD